MKLTAEEEARFWLTVSKVGPTIKDDLGPCWPWMGNIAKCGYGRFCFRGYRQYTHRIALELTVGDITGFEACHKCDNPKCCNPAHIFKGSKKANAMDSAAKGRQHLCKLSPDEVKVMREFIKDLPLDRAGRLPPGTVKYLGKLMGVHPDIASKAARGKSFRLL